MNIQTGKLTFNRAIGLMKNIFSLGETPSYPRETNKGVITRNGKTITVHSSVEHYVILADNILFISVRAYCVENRNEASLCVVDEDADDYYKKKFIPCHFKGFKQTYEWLTSNFSFDQDIFFELTNRLVADRSIDAPVEKMLWRKIQKQNFDIRSHYPPDVDEGFEVLAPKPFFVKWNTPYEEILKNHLGSLTENENGVYINFPVRIGNIEINETIDYDQLTAKLVMPGRGTKSYFELKDALIRLCNSKDFTAHENKEQGSYFLYLKYKILTFRLNYPSPYSNGPTYFKDPDLTVFSIEVDFPKTYDLAYEEVIHMDGSLSFTEDVTLGNEFQRDHPEVQPRPHRISELFGPLPVLWVDKKNNKLGFADYDNCWITKLDSFRNFTIQTIPGEYTRLSIGDDREVMISDQVHVDPFKSVADALKQLTGKQVLILDDADFHIQSGTDSDYYSADSEEKVNSCEFAYYAKDDGGTNSMNTIFSNIKYLPDYDGFGYFGYSVYQDHVEYLDANEMIGFGDTKYWSHQEFYDEFNNQQDNLMAKEVIEFLVAHKLVKATDTKHK